MAIGYPGRSAYRKLQKGHSAVSHSLTALHTTVSISERLALTHDLGGLAAAFDAGGPTWIDWQDTIVEGAPTPVITQNMYPMLRDLVDDVVLVTEEEVKSAMRQLALSNKLVTEGAGAASVATVHKVPPHERGVSVCVVSGGSVDPELITEVIGSA